MKLSEGDLNTYITTRAQPTHGLFVTLADSFSNSLHTPIRTIFCTVCQSVFKTGHSTETALLAIIEKLHTARTASVSPAVILLDLSKAFHTDNHQILRSTLQVKGISARRLVHILSEGSHLQANVKTICLRTLQSQYQGPSVVSSLSSWVLSFTRGLSCYSYEQPILSFP